MDKLLIKISDHGIDSLFSESQLTRIKSLNDDQRRRLKELMYTDSPLKAQESDRSLSEIGLVQIDDSGDIDLSESAKAIVVASCEKGRKIPFI